MLSRDQGLAARVRWFHFRAARRMSVFHVIMTLGGFQNQLDSHAESRVHGLHHTLNTQFEVLRADDDFEHACRLGKGLAFPRSNRPRLMSERLQRCRTGTPVRKIVSTEAVTRVPGLGPAISGSVAQASHRRTRAASAAQS